MKKQNKPVVEINQDPVKKTGKTKANVPIKRQRIKPVAKRAIAIVLVALTLMTTTAMALLNYKPFSQGDIDETMTNDDALKDDFLNILICGVDEVNQLTDVMMVVSFNIKENKINILQIPRDTYVGPEYISRKANAVYNNGPSDTNKIGNLISVIKEQFGMPIDHYVTITMKGFRKAIDAIGGVEVNMPYEIPSYNKVHNGTSISKGKQTLNGTKAEILVRYRKGYNEGDIGRVKAQRIFVSAMVDQVKKAGAGELMNLLNSVMGHLTSDMSVNDMYKIGVAAMKVDMKQMEMHLMPGQSASLNGLSFYSVHLDQLVKLLNEKFRPFQEDVTAEDLKAYELANTVDTNDNTGNSVQDILDGATPGDDTVNKKEDDE